MNFLEALRNCNKKFEYFEGIRYYDLTDEGVIEYLHTGVEACRNSSAFHDQIKRSKMWNKAVVRKFEVLIDKLV